MSDNRNQGREMPTGFSDIEPPKWPALTLQGLLTAPFPFSGSPQPFRWDEIATGKSHSDEWYRQATIKMLESHQESPAHADDALPASTSVTASGSTTDASGDVRMESPETGGELDFSEFIQFPKSCSEKSSSPDSSSTVTQKQAKRQKLDKTGDENGTG